MQAANSKAVASYARTDAQTIVEFLLNIIPNTVMDAFARGEILPVLLFSILFGIAQWAAATRGPAAPHRREASRPFPRHPM